MPNIEVNADLFWVPITDIRLLIGCYYKGYGLTYLHFVPQKVLHPLVPYSEIASGE